MANYNGNGNGYNGGYNNGNGGQGGYGNQNNGGYNGNGGNQQRRGNYGGNRNGGNRQNGGNRDYNLVKNFGLRCFRSKPMANNSGYYLDCAMTGKRNEDGSWGKSLSVNVMCYFNRCDMPNVDFAGANINVDGQFTISDYKKADGSTATGITIYADKISLSERQPQRRSGNGGQGGYGNQYQNNGGGFGNGGNYGGNQNGNYGNGGQNGYNNGNGGYGNGNQYQNNQNGGYNGGGYSGNGNYGGGFNG